MKIVFVLECANITNNGTGATCLRFAEELRKKGHKVTILGGILPPDSKESDYVEFDHYNFPVFEWLIRKEGFAFATTKNGNKKMYDAIKDCDVVHIFLPFKFGSRARLVAQVCDKPVTIAFHLQPENITSAIHMGKIKPINDILYASFKQYMYRHIKYVHCPSQMIANQLEKHNYPGENVVISNGINDYFHPIDVAKPEEYKDKFVVVMVGRLAGEKRQDLLIKAIAKSKYNSNIQLVLCGQGPEEKRYRKLAKKVGLANPIHIKFCTQEELRNVLNYSDLYVHASDAEIEGIAAIEAFATGLVPIISDSKLSATNQFSLDEHCLFKHGNANSLAERIDFFYENPEFKKELSSKYIEEAKEYALPFQVEKMEKMLEMAIEDHKNQKDFYKLYPTKKDRRKMNKIRKDLIKQGVKFD